MFFIKERYIKDIIRIIVDWTGALFADEKGVPSSKRFIGILAGLSLCISLFINQFKGASFAPSPILINAVAALAFGALGLSSADKIWSKSKISKFTETPTINDSVSHEEQPQESDSNFEDDDFPPED